MCDMETVLRYSRTIVEMRNMYILGVPFKQWPLRLQCEVLAAELLRFEFEELEA